MKRLREIAINLAFMALSLVVVLLFCEFVVFRYVLLPSEPPWLDFANGVVRYAPNQRGAWRQRDDIDAPYWINAQGWNSRQDYRRDRTPGVTRVAVIGDSFIEAFQVPYDRSMAEHLARQLTDGGKATEVHRFAIGGAPLSQYVHMAEREAAPYRPDWIVVNIVSNDFDESWKSAQNRFTSYFLKYRLEGARVVGETPPTPWHDTPVEWLRRSAILRYFFNRWMLRPDAIINFVLMRQAGAETLNINLGPSAREDLEAVTDYTAQRLATVAGSIGARVLLVMDGERTPLYTGAAPGPALELNRIVAAAAARHGLGFLDMHPVFAAHWAAHRQRFDFETDWHWNELGHSVVGAAVADYIRNAR